MPVAILAAVLFLLGSPSAIWAEVTRVAITSRAVVADGQPFGATGAYEKLTGTVEYALDPADRHNTRIVDLEHSTRGSDGRVHFTSDMYVLRPVDAAKGNGVLLFEISNRGGKFLVSLFNRARASTDPTAPGDFGDGFLMREGYTLVWIGWEFDVASPLLRIDAPMAALPAGPIIAPLSIEIIVNQRTAEASLIDLPELPPVRYLPVNENSPSDVLTVRDRFWDRPATVPREKWRFVSDASGAPKLRLDGGFEPGRYYQVTYQATGARVAGAGLAAIRDAASAFRYRSDLPVSGKSAYVFGLSQSGRFLREFLYDGFNADEGDRRVFDAVWPHIAGAARGSFNERFATPIRGELFGATQFPFTDLDQRDADGTQSDIEKVYQPEQRPKIFYTNTSVEYWGFGRAAALTHVAIDGKKDAQLPDNVRIYLLSGTQNVEGAFPPRMSNGQQLNNPTPQADVMRALLRALNQWVASGTRPPDSRYPRLSDGTLVPVAQVRFPGITGVADPRRITGPARVIAGVITPLPFLVPQVDADGNEMAGIRVPEVTVPLATTTGWNFRAEAVGNPGDIYTVIGSYIPFAATRAERQARHDPRPSIEERYRNRGEYLNRITAAATKLVQGRLLLSEDMDDVVARASAHWQYATRDRAGSSVVRP